MSLPKVAANLRTIIGLSVSVLEVEAGFLKKLQRFQSLGRIFQSLGRKMPR
jgi:hypothetical protein